MAAGLAEVLSIGKLLAMQWQLGVSVQSNHCENLDAPFVSVQLRVEDANRDVSTHSFDLTLLEFKVRSLLRAFSSFSLLCSISQSLSATLMS